MMKTTSAILTTLAVSAMTAAAGVAPAPAPVNCPIPKAASPCDVPISYNNAELLYAWTDLDGTGEEMDGGILRFEYSPMEHFYVAASAQYHEVANIEIWAITAGVGGYMPLTERIHLVLEAGGVWADVDVGSTFDDGSGGNGWSEDDTGWYVRPHVRARFGCLEVHAGAQYTEISSLGSYDVEEWAAFANLYYQVAPQWDVTLGVTHSTDRTTVTGGARYRF
jgi:hypothetical protein